MSKSTQANASRHTGPLSVRTAIEPHHWPTYTDAKTQRCNYSDCLRISLVLVVLWAESPEFFLRLLGQELSRLPPLTVVYHSADWRPLCLSPRILRHWVPIAKMKHYEVSTVCETLNLQRTVSWCNIRICRVWFSTIEASKNKTCTIVAFAANGSIEALVLLRRGYIACHASFDKGYLWSRSNWPQCPVFWHQTQTPPRVVASSTVASMCKCWF